MRQSLNPCLLAALAVCGMLISGCRTVGTRSQEKAAAVEEAALEARTRAHAHYAAAVVHDINEEQELALQEYYLAALNEPEDESMVLEVSRRLVMAKQVQKALDLLQTAADRPTASGAILARLGLVYLQLDKNAQAAEAGHAAIEKSPRQMAGYQTLFRHDVLLNRGDDALRVLDRAASVSDTDAEFLTGLAELYISYIVMFPSKRSALEAKTLAVLERTAHQKPESAMTRLRLADGFSVMGKTEEAAKFYQQALGDLEQTPVLRDTVRTKLIETYLRSRDYKRASPLLEDMVRDDPSNAQAYYFLGTIACDEQRWADASDNLEKAILFNPQFEQAYYDLASARIAMGKGNEALITLESARTKFPQNFLMEYLFGVAYSESKAYVEATQHFTAAEVVAKAGETNRLSSGFYFQFGAACERKGDRDLAETYFRKAINMTPDFAQALNYLGYMWAERGERLEEAKELIERALKAEPNSSAYTDSLGWVLFKQGQAKPALDYILKAIDLAKEPEAELYDHLGDIYAAMNEPAKARDAWRKALAVEPDEKIEKKLKDSESK